MSVENIGDRLQKLRDLRTKLCSKEDNWQEAFKARDWIVDQIKSLHTMTECDTTSIGDIKNRLEDILCVLDPDKDGDEK